jgi:hypothetical protein
MTKVIVKQLREKAFRTETYDLFNSAADRIEQLEAALRDVIDNFFDGARICEIARKALEGKDVR